MISTIKIIANTTSTPIEISEKLFIVFCSLYNIENNLAEMCDLTSLNNKYLTYAEPSPLFWDTANCAGTQMTLKPGEYTTLDGQRLGRNMIDAIWVPPNMSIDVYDGINYSAGMGHYDPGLYADLDNPRIGLGKNAIDSLKITRTKPWSDHLAACCTGKVTNGATPEMCGMWWGKGTDASGVCDELMENYCEANPDDSKCSCYGVPELDTDTLDVKLLKAQPKCWSQKCSTSGYLPSNMIGSTCPNVKICKQDINLPGSNNILQDNQYIQDCSDTYVAPSTTPDTPPITTPGTPPITTPGTPPITTPGTPGSGTSGMPANMWYYIIGFILFLIAVVIFFGKNKSQSPSSYSSG
jgi:hypothetical protein